MGRLRSAWFWLVGHAGVNRLTRAMHPVLYRWTGGRSILGRSLGNLTVLITTVGRLSGRPRTTALWAFPDGEALVLVGSYAGARRAPAWVHNLRAHPEATVQVGRSVRRMAAREAAGEEYERLWRMVTHAYPGYQAYLAWAHRTIPLVVLEPPLRGAGGTGGDG